MGEPSPHLSALPKSEAALERAVESNSDIATHYAQHDPDGNWAQYHHLRAEACRARLSGLFMAGDAA